PGGRPVAFIAANYRRRCDDRTRNRVDRGDVACSDRCSSRGRTVVRPVSSAIVVVPSCERIAQAAHSIFADHRLALRAVFCATSGARLLQSALQDRPLSGLGLRRRSLPRARRLGVSFDQYGGGWLTASNANRSSSLECANPPTTKLWDASDASGARRRRGAEALCDSH